MKRILFAFLLLAQLGFAGDPHKGQIFYQYVVSPITDVRGDTFTKTHTKAEWETLMRQEGKAFLSTYKIPQGTLDAEALEHLRAFFVHYA
ncbi:MAG: hypothetical protein IBX45_09305, partial [Campylobacterales bacterium]|nr:hypothetical protein [Campylobacterales bacterium]